MEAVTAIGLMFVLAYDLPPTWFVSSAREINAASPDAWSRMMVVMFVVSGVALHHLSGQLGEIIKVMRREPLLPSFVAMMLLSVLWTADVAVTYRESLAIAAVLFLGYWIVLRFTLRQIIGYASIALGCGTVLHYLWVFGVSQYGKSPAGWTGLFGHKNTLGSSAVLAVLVALFATRAYPRLRIPAYALAAANVGLALGSDSKTAQVSLIILLPSLTIIWMFRARRTLYGAVALTLITGSVALIQLGQRNLEVVADTLERDVTLTGRTKIWSAAMTELREEPLLGYGWNAFWRGWFSPAHDVWRELPAGRPGHAHNALLQYALHLGVIGAAIALFLFIRLLVRSARLVRISPDWRGMWPMAFATYTLMFSITELGVIRRDLAFLLFVIAVSRATLAATSPPAPHVRGAQHARR